MDNYLDNRTTVAIMSGYKDNKFKCVANYINLVCALLTCSGGILCLFFIFRLKITVINKMCILLNLSLFFCLPIGNILFSFYNIKHFTTTPMIHFTMAFGGHMLRFGVLGVVIERLFATVYWRTYQIRPTFQTFIAISLTVASISITFVITLLTHLFRVDMNLRNIAIFITHTGSLLVALFLIYKNQKLHQLSRFRPLLLQRYQLAQNLKNLRILKPYIIILATLGPITPLIYQILYLVGDSTIDVSIPVLYTLYDLSLIACEAIFLFSIFKSNYQKQATATVSSAYIKQDPKQQRIQTALGTYIPTLQTAEDYFVELRNTWM